MGLFRWMRGDRASEPDRYKVILYDDPLHGYAYVVYMLEQICGLPQAAGFNLAKLIDESGSAVVFAGTRDECEHVRRMISEHGPDTTLESSESSMRAEIVRAINV